MLPVSETFYSLQGEGLWSGMPSVFIRLAGCNLRCTWCDTPYALAAEQGERQRMEDVLEYVEGTPAEAHVVVTGGEPMLHLEVAALTRALKAAGRPTTIETNGTIAPGDVVCDLVSISPKLSNSVASGMTAPAWPLDSIRRWLQRFNCQFKFVVRDAADVDEVERFLIQLNRDFPRERIFLMPEGRTPDVVNKRSQWLSDICLARAFRFGRRLQLDLYGDKRGT